ncbi:protoporphyrin oxidase, flavoprotein [Wigglesworthia glossinidia endosymbiont of Glossina morsitans morsitans (Yale colony)]|uniref:Protoporphyrinogen IX dehydrogenase [quinone] n=1 Tax=Wigglesworthia glossinidia endosymbiont of Glossina morsitans morsitans (Yale colony) TaxID=1142511 RepID=H6Q4D0_WIGGL|nr:menaquinone-dependent protoporphyrinogen IX dehydrogenase [Wigglesworthia glossinidia]AFA40990.1 protoporphyrin oxidase, flavoprotein [Wigglesworthia glossinidia endosymbiont of Glossina morsitans morsitans (Yale colony)]
MKTLILYSSRNGHTCKIAHFIANFFRQSKFCDVKNLHSNFDINLEKYQRIVIGASVRYGYFSIKFYKFVKDKIYYLNSIPSAFYAVNLLARYDHYSTPNTNVYTKKFLKNTLWCPKISAVFAGALKYSQYNILIKLLIFSIMKINNKNMSIKNDIEFTDWEQVKEFANHIIQL